MNRLLLVVGGLLITLGLCWSSLRRVPLFHLPGDLVFERSGIKIFSKLLEKIR